MRQISGLALLTQIFFKILEIVPLSFEKSRNSRWEVFCRKGVLRNFAKLIGKHLRCNFTKKETLTQVFSYEFCEIFKGNFSFRTSLDYCFWKKKTQEKKTVEGKLLMIASIHFIALKTFSLFVKHEVQNLKAR